MGNPPSSTRLLLYMDKWGNRHHGNRLPKMVRITVELCLRCDRQETLWPVTKATLIVKYLALLKFTKRFLWHKYPENVTLLSTLEGSVLKGKELLNCGAIPLLYTSWFEYFICSVMWIGCPIQTSITNLKLCTQLTQGLFTIKSP